jgi:hypothetical protein
MRCSTADGFHGAIKETFVPQALIVENNYRKNLSNAVKYCKML